MLGIPILEGYIFVVTCMLLLIMILFIVGGTWRERRAGSGAAGGGPGGRGGRGVGGEKKVETAGVGLRGATTDVICGLLNHRTTMHQRITIPPHQRA